jgi:hypothetical protein
MRAHTAGIQITGTGYRKIDRRPIICVTSCSQLGVSHIVTIYGSALRCDCLAGKSNHYCMHLSRPVHSWLSRTSADGGRLCNIVT